MNYPGPGIYEGVPFSDYICWPYMNNSTLRQGLRTMAHMRAYMDMEDRPDTRSLAFGRFVHTARLEPLAIAQHYVVQPPFELDEENTTKAGVRTASKATAYYKGQVAKFTEANRSMEVVTQDEYDRMRGMMRALQEHPRARQYLDCIGPTEVCVVWDDPITGVRCKIRVDKWDEPNHRIPDLKTTRDAGNFAKSIVNYGYDMQGALYVDGMLAATGVEHSFPLIAIESDPPYGVRAAPLSEMSLEIGRAKYRRVLSLYSQAIQSNKWPGYTDPEEWELPAWAMDDTQGTGTELQVNGRTVRL